MNGHQGFMLVSHDGTRPAAHSRRATRNAVFAAVLAMDATIVTALSCVTGVLYHLAVHGDVGAAAPFVTVGLVAASMFTLGAAVRGDYAAQTLLARPRPMRTLHLWNLTFAILLVLGFVTKTGESYSRGAIIVFYCATIPVLIGARFLAASAVRRAGRVGLLCLSRVFLFGEARSIRAFMEGCEPRANGMFIVGCRFVTPMNADLSHAARMAGLDADLRAALGSARHLAPDVVILMLPWSADDMIERCTDAFKALPAEIHLGPDRILQRFPDVQTTRLGAFVSLTLMRVPLSRLEVGFKRAFDILAATAGLALLTPVLVAVAALIKLDSRGPVFFLQRRYGFNQRPFRIVKFRTMHTADDGAVVKQATRDDPRVTRVGRWLRRWNIDEIPQLFNVIMGDMSLVGPRPHALAHDEEYGRTIAAYARRHNVKPGITGWAQVHGFRGETDTHEKMEQRVKYDLHYIENWSLMLDVKIIMRTLVSAAAYRSAY